MTISMKERMRRYAKSAAGVFVFLAAAMATTFGQSVISADTAWAAGEEEQKTTITVRTGCQPVTVKNVSDGRITEIPAYGEETFSNVVNEHLLVTGMNLPGTYRHMTTSVASDAKSGWMSVATEDIDAEGLWGRFITFMPSNQRIDFDAYCDIDSDVFDISQPMLPDDIEVSLMNTGTADRPEVGDVFTGNMYVVYNGQTTPNGDTGEMKMKSQDGILGSMQMGNMYCQAHGAAAPYNGMSGHYSARVTSVNKTTGQVFLWVYWESWEDPQRGVEYPPGTGWIAGYQQVGGTVEIHRDYCGWLSFQKVSSNPSATNGNAFYTLQGAVFRLSRGSWYADYTTDANGYVKTGELELGTYNWEEIKAPHNYKKDPNCKGTITVISGQTTPVSYKQSGKIVNEPQTTIALNFFKDSERPEADELVPSHYQNTNGYGNSTGYYDYGGLSFWVVRQPSASHDTCRYEQRLTFPLGAESIQFAGLPYGYYKFYECADNKYYKFPQTVKDPVYGYPATTSEWDVKLGAVPAEGYDLSCSDITASTDFKQNPTGDDSTPEDKQYLGSLEIYKTSTDVNTLGSPWYNFAGVKYKAVSQSGDTYYITLNANGYGRCDEMVFGTYRITEIEGNQYYKRNTAWSVTKDITTDNTRKGTVPIVVTAAENKDEPYYGELEIQKRSTDDNTDLKQAGATDQYQYYNMKNIVYHLVGQDKGMVYDIVLDDSGYGKQSKIVFDKYTVTETVTNNFYEKNDAFNAKNYTMEISSRTTGVQSYFNNHGGLTTSSFKTHTAGGMATNTTPVLLTRTGDLSFNYTNAYDDPYDRNDFRDVPLKGSFIIEKHSTLPYTEQMTDYYNFENIEYTLVGQRKKNPMTYTITLPANGVKRLDNIVFDTYEVKESKTNSSYAMSDESWLITIDTSNTTYGTTPMKLEPKDVPNFGRLEIQKRSYDPASEENPYYNFAGIVYKAHGEDKGNDYFITLDESGFGFAAGVEFDTYTITEEESNQWYQKSDASYTAVVSRDNTMVDGVPGVKAITQIVKDYPTYIRFSFQKASTDGQFTLDNHAYSLCGAEYQLDCTRNPETVYSGTVATTNTHGTAYSDWMLVDDYIAYEKKASPGYAVSLQQYITKNYSQVLGSINVIADGSSGFVGEDGQSDFSLRIVKLDARSDSNVASGDATLEGAVFKLEYYGTDDIDEIESAPIHRTWYLKTKSDGEAYLDELAAGPMTVTTRQDGMPVTQTFVSDEPFYNEGHLTIPCGILTVQEVLNPKGYLFDNGTVTGPGTVKTYVIEGNRSSSEAAIERLNTRVVYDMVESADTDVIKTEAGTGVPMGGIPFLITSQTTGEKHVGVTDANGLIRTGVLRTTNLSGVNLNDSLLGEKDGVPIITNEHALNPNSGVYFYGFGPNNDPDGSIRASLTPSAGYYAFPTDTYKVEELAASSNYAHTLETFYFTVTKNEGMPALTVTDAPIEIQTTATDNGTGAHVGNAEKATVTINDEVRYNNLTPGHAYTMTGTLMDKATGQPLVGPNGETYIVDKAFSPLASRGTVDLQFEVPGEVLANKTVVVFERLSDTLRQIADHQDINDEGQTVWFPVIGTTATDVKSGVHDGFITADKIEIKDVIEFDGLKPGETYTVVGKLMDKATNEALVNNDGEPVTATTDFVPETGTGNTEVTFVIDRAAIIGKTVVAYESLFQNDILVATHQDINDEGQTVDYPAIQTEALDEVTEIHEGYADQKYVTMTDRIYYENLVAGQKYVMSGVVMDAATGKPLTDESGEEVRNLVSFVAGTDEVTVYGTVIEEDEANEAESAEDEEAETAEDEEAQAEAELEALLHPNSTVFAAIPTNTPTVPENIPAKFKSDESESEIPVVDEATGHVSGTIKVSFTVPGSCLMGKTVVVFQNLYIDTNDVLAEVPVVPSVDEETTESVEEDELTAPEEDDSEDAGEEASLAADDDTELNAGESEDEEGEEGEEGDRDYGNAFDEIEDNSTPPTYRPLSADQIMELTAQMALVYNHEELDNRDQTIWYPSIGTTATVNGAHSAPAYGDAKLIDVVAYENLEPNVEYEVVGILMNKATGEPAAVENPHSSTRFVPEQENGTVEVTFEFNTDELEGVDVVVFERVYKLASNPVNEDALVASHQDINDEGQTVRFNHAEVRDQVKVIPPLPETGEIVGALLVGGIVIAGVAALATRSARRRNQ